MTSKNMQKVFVYDPTRSDKLSSVRGVGRYLQILKENFPDWTFKNDLHATRSTLPSVFINPFFNFLSPPLTLTRLAKKQIAVIHDLIPLKYPSHFPAGIRGSLNILLNKLTLKNYDLVITDSEASKKDIIKNLGINENKIKIVYPCLPKIFKSEIRNAKSLSAGRQGETNSKPLNFNNSNLNIVSNLDIRASNFCLYVGDATWNKNLVNLAKAIKIANVTCVFVGKVFNPSYTLHATRYTINNPWQREFKQFIEEIKNDKRFVFAGFVPDSDLIKYYQQATVNVLPSRDEGFGFSFLEAGHFSCPSILSDIPVLNEISKENAIYIDPEDPADLADKIKIIYSDGGLRDNFGKQANTRSQFFSPEKFKKEFVYIINSL